jgi:ketosteroid isomerase-like protein
MRWSNVSSSLVGFAVALLLVFAWNNTQTPGEPAPENEVEQFADRFWDSFNQHLAKGALDVYLENWDERAERITPTVHARGIDEIRATYEGYLQTYSDLNQTEVRRVVDGNLVVSELLTDAKRKSDGSVLSLPNVAIVEFNEKGKVIRARVYMDTREFGG